MLESRFRAEHLYDLEELTRRRLIRNRMREAELELEHTVLTARAAGFGWEAIGATWGMTRQSAHERWASANILDD